MDGSKRPGVTSAAKEGAWATIASEMEGFGPLKRTMQELKRKKETWFSETKAKVRVIPDFKQDNYIKTVC